MGRRFLLLWLLLVASLALAGCSATTPTEAAAIAAAKLDHTAYTLPPDKLAKAIVLNHFFDLLLLVRTAWGLVSLWLLLQLGMAARMRDCALRFSNNIWLQAVTFTAMFLALWLLLRLPLNMLGHWKSVQYGFSVQTWASWFGDIGKNWLLNVALYASGAMLLFWVMRRSPRRWWLWLWFPTVVLSLFLAALEPMLIAPLFDHYEPLARAHPALVQQLEAVANHGGISIPPDRMYLMKASEKSTLMNAEVTGFGSSKRLVLYDTLLDKATPDEIALIAGHEMGHYVLGHIKRGIAMGLVGLLAAFFVGFHLFQWLLRRFGVRWRIPAQEDWAAVVLLVFVLNLLLFFAEPIQNVISRGVEHDADVFGQEVVHGVVANPQATGQAAEQALGENYLSDPNPSPLMEFWFDSHPSTSFRAAFAEHYNPWTPGAQPKYFKK